MSGSAAPFNPEENWRATLDLMRRVNRHLFSVLGEHVRTGPFIGMRVAEIPSWDDGNAGSKLVGCYEFELHPTISYALTRGYETVVNVGCAEGYYAIGLAKALPQARVHAIDRDRKTLRQCWENSKLNGADERMTFSLGAGAPEQINIQSRGRSLYVVDVEGHERDLLDKTKCPALVRSDIIVECHDFFDPENPISRVLADRFMDTHRVYLINTEIPNAKHYPFLSGFPFGLQLMVLNERRPAPTTWLACWADN